jgi:mannose-6-phosphate isomerase-like protein (cupin superfamily)
VLRRDDLAARFPSAPGATGAHEVARGGQSSVNYWVLGSEMPAHLHRAHEEVIIVQSGTVEAMVGSRRVLLGPGDVLLVPRDTVHSGRVASGGPARGYSVFSPAFDGVDRVPVPAPGATP